MFMSFLQPLPTKLVLQKKKAKEGRSGDEIEHFPVPSRITVSRTATIRQTSQAGKKEPRILKEGALVQLVDNSTPITRSGLASDVLRLAAIVELNGLREILKICHQSFRIAVQPRQRRKSLATAEGCGIQDCRGMSRAAAKESFAATRLIAPLTPRPRP